MLQNKPWTRQKLTQMLYHAFIGSLADNAVELGWVLCFSLLADKNLVERITVLFGVNTGTILKKSNLIGDTYVHKVVEKVESVFRTEHSCLSQDFVTFYTQLVLTALSANIELTKEMIHDAWSVATYHRDAMKLHPSMKPFDHLRTEIQELDQPYVDKLNEVLDYFKGLRNLTKNEHTVMMALP